MYSKNVEALIKRVLHGYIYKLYPGSDKLAEYYVVSL